VSSVGGWLAGFVASDSPTLFSCGVVLDFGTAKASPIVAGRNATARPNMELAVKNRRRELSSSLFILWSLRTVPGFVAVWPCGTSPS
jgi:hypothetical protein